MIIFAVGMSNCFTLKHDIFYFFIAYSLNSLGRFGRSRPYKGFLIFLPIKGIFHKLFEFFRRKLS